MAKDEEIKDEDIKIGDTSIFVEAKDFDELYTIFKNEEEIFGSGGESYGADDLIIIIDEFRERLKVVQQKAEIKKISGKVIKKLIKGDQGLMDKIRCVTRENDLRFKAVELAIKEAITRRVSKEPKPDLSDDTVIQEKKEEGE